MYTAQHHQLFSSFKQLKINKILAIIIFIDPSGLYSYVEIVFSYKSCKCQTLVHMLL